MDFKNFFTETTEYEKDLKKTLEKLPKKFRDLVSGYKFKFQPGNTLKGDKTHIGILDPDKKTVTVCAPWNYSREYAILHELGHTLWSTLSLENKEKWKKVLKSHPSKDSPRQSEEEYFAMAFSDTFSKNSISKFDIPQWHSFIKSL